MAPKVQILMATYINEKMKANGSSGFLREQLDSIFEQTEQDFELIIRDDKSPCRSDVKEILEEYKERYGYKIRIIYGEKNLGATENFFELMKLVTAPIFILSDQDDIFPPDKFEKLIKAIEEKNSDKPLLAYHDFSCFSGDTQITGSMNKKYNANFGKETLQDLFLRPRLWGFTSAGNKQLTDVINSHDKEGVKCHDQIISIIAKTYGDIIYIDEVLGKHREHNFNESARLSAPKPQIEQMSKIEKFIDRFSREGNERLEQIKIILKNFPDMPEKSKKIYEGFIKAKKCQNPVVRKILALPYIKSPTNLNNAKQAAGEILGF